MQMLDERRLMQRQPVGMVVHINILGDIGMLMCMKTRNDYDDHDG